MKKTILFLVLFCSSTTIFAQNAYYGKMKVLSSFSCDGGGMNGVNFEFIPNDKILPSEIDRKKLKKLFMYTGPGYAVKGDLYNCILTKHPGKTGIEKWSIKFTVTKFKLPKPIIAEEDVSGLD